MNKKLSRIMQPSMRLFFAVLIVFSVVSVFFNYYLAIGEAVAIILLAFYTRYSGRRRKKEILSYIESVSFSIDDSVKDSILSFPLPVTVISPGDDQIIWSNSHFLEMTGRREHMFETTVGDLVPAFSGRWLLEGKNESPSPVQVGDRLYTVYGSLVRSQGGKRRGFMGALCWVDVTELVALRDEHAYSKPVTMVIMIDNYDELLSNLSETQKSSILAAVDDRINAWTQDSEGYLCKYDRDRYVFIFEERHLQGFIDGKFSALDTVRTVVSPAGVAASLSIGVGKDSGSFLENYQYAQLGIEMALSRGGDQAVLKNRYNFEFYGGRSKEVEKRSKVKSRVMANALSELISGAGTVFIMGHKLADFDSLGAAAGVSCICRKLGVRHRIVLNLKRHNAQPLYERLAALPEYRDVFISPDDAIIAADSRSLLVVVDTNRPDQVESEELLASCNHVAVIDHHRRAAEYIQNADLNFHEPYASSACELVSEIIQYVSEQSDVLRSEAEALLCGIMLDTKNFTMRTGGRTFEAAAFLRRLGADTTDVKRLLQSDFSSTLARYGVIQRAKLLSDDIAIAALDERVERVVAAQAADELLNIQGISCTFVIFPEDDQIIVSARSMGEINVQVVLEKLGGGGNKATAGAQVRGMTQKQVLAEIVTALEAHRQGAAAG